MVAATLLCELCGLCERNVFLLFFVIPSPKAST